jgi:hypothetical protein
MNNCVIEMMSERRRCHSLLCKRGNMAWKSFQC